MSGNALGCLTFSLGFEKNYNCLWLSYTVLHLYLGFHRPFGSTSAEKGTLAQLKVLLNCGASLDPEAK